MVGDPLSGWVNRIRQLPCGELSYLAIMGSDGFSRNPQNF